MSEAMLATSDQGLAELSDVAHRIAEDEMERLLSELEPSLSDRQCSLLHQIRFLAESMGAARVGARESASTPFTERRSASRQPGMQWRS